MWIIGCNSPRFSYSTNMADYRNPHFILCKTCGKKKYINPAAGYKYCSRACREKDPEYRMKLPQRKPHAKILNKICKKCKQKFTVQNCYRYRKFCSLLCSQKFRTGKNHHLYTGFPYSPYGANWLSQQSKARARTNNTCSKCGKTKRQNKNKNMDVHHIMPFKLFGKKQYKKANRLSNLVALCMSCHRKEIKDTLQKLRVKKVPVRL